MQKIARAIDALPFSTRWCPICFIMRHYYPMSTPSRKGW